MKQIFLFLFIFLFTSCISGGAKQEQVKVVDRTIRIGDAMEHPVPMKLSAFVDSITYVPLETTYFSIIGTYSIILKLQSSKSDCYPQSHFPKLGLAPFSWTHLLR